MRIAKVEVIEADCLLEDVIFWQERLGRPQDIYPDRFDWEATEGGTQTGDGWRFTTRFVVLTSAEGVPGVAGPITQESAHAVLSIWAPLLLGSAHVSPRRVWDEGYRRMPHGRLGDGMLALSAVELALWDLWGNAHGVPVVDLIGGPTRERIPAYASMLGFPVTDHERMANLASEHQALGLVGQKWYFRYGPADGEVGFHHNLAMARALRDAVGDGYPLMFDAWQSLDVNYASRLADALTELKPTWLEEPLLPDQLEGMKRLRRRTRIPLAGGEHLYTKWGFTPVLRAGVYDVIQPDLYWAGGLTETMRIAAVAEAFDTQVIAHAHSPNATAHFSLAQSPAVTPWQEHLIRWNMVHQFLLRHPVQPSDGFIDRPMRPGLAMELDLDRAVAWRYLSA